MNVSLVRHLNIKKNSASNGDLNIGQTNSLLLAIAFGQKLADLTNLCVNRWQIGSSRSGLVRKGVSFGPNTGSNPGEGQKRKKGGK